MTFNKSKYQQQYNKEHYSQVKVDLPKEMKKELVDICNRQDISIRKFILDAIERAEKDLKK